MQSNYDSSFTAHYEARPRETSEVAQEMLQIDQGSFIDDGNSARNTDEEAIGDVADDEGDEDDDDAYVDPSSRRGENRRRQRDLIWSF